MTDARGNEPLSERRAKEAADGGSPAKKSAKSARSRRRRRPPRRRRRSPRRRKSTAKKTTAKKTTKRPDTPLQVPWRLPVRPWHCQCFHSAPGWFDPFKPPGSGSEVSEGGCDRACLVTTRAYPRLPAPRYYPRSASVGRIGRASCVIDLRPRSPPTSSRSTATARLHWPGAASPHSSAPGRACPLPGRSAGPRSSPHRRSPCTETVLGADVPGHDLTDGDTDTGRQLMLLQFQVQLPGGGQGMPGDVVQRDWCAEHGQGGIALGTC